MFRLLFIFTGITLSLTISAQVVTVTDQALKPVESATISSESGRTWVTDAMGQATLDLNEAQQLYVQHVSFLSKAIWVKPGQNQRVVLQPQVGQLNDVVVEGFADDEKLSNLAGSIARLEPADLKRFDQLSLVSAVNTIPGVRFEERAGSSYRVSIRGSSIRSPFGVRNVKVYWNGIPFTEPGGNTFLNLLDLANVGEMEIIKGPAGSAYGAGNGGVMKLKSTNLSQLSNATSIGLLGGSHGNFRSQVQSNWLGEKTSVTAKYAYQQSDGYRDHNEMQRHTGEIDMLYFPKASTTYSVSLLYSDLFYEIPGGLNPTQLAANRRQARPGSEDFNASIDHQYFLVRGGQEHEFSSTFRSDINAYFYTRHFENPFNLDYKRDEENGVGLRFQLENDFELFGRNASITYGHELQRANFKGKNFGNVAGEADTIRFSDKLVNDLSFWFADAKLNLADGLKLTLGASLNHIQYDINRLEDKINNTPGRVVQEFDRVFSPRIALSKVWSPSFSTHLSVSHGYSPPTSTEIRTNEGTINSALQPEIGVNYELNLRGAFVKSRLSYDLALFTFKLDESITTETNNQGVVLFRNSGQIDQQGLEAALAWDWLGAESLRFSKLLTRLSYTYHHFEFSNYVDGGDDLSGKALPGTAPNVVSIMTDLALNSSFYANLTFQYVDEIPLNDENTVYADAYELFQLRLGYQMGTARADYEFFAGVDNLFNEDYSLGNDLNAFGQRYFQPAPARSVYLGINLKIKH
ncbi:TonB-dependent receptor [Roseivirga sp.]|uniref:TonB-dependent receptor n=1 Tax=Roseivirga sp. TaxID=1964215 RepID=UPI003B527CED